MPAIAVVAAIGTISAGATLGGVLGGIMIAGGVMSAAGAVTGNKELTKWGAVASLGAGIGAAAGLAGSANSMWNSAVGAGADGAGSALGVTGESFLKAGGSMESIGNTLGLNKAAAAAPAVSDAYPPGQSIYGVPSDVAGATQSPGIVAKQVAGEAAKPGWLGFIKDNPEVVKAGSGLVGGAMTSYSKQREQEAALQAQEDALARRNNSILGQRYRSPSIITRG
jgi:hypothetical protein